MKKNKYINRNLGELPYHQKLRQYDLSDLLLFFAANSFDASAMWDDKSIYLIIETGEAFTVDLS